MSGRSPTACINSARFRCPRMILRRNVYPRVRRTMATVPKPGETLMDRRSDRELPQIVSSWRPWLRTAPIFIIVITISALGIFNYQKTNSSVVASTLYALRTSEIGRKELGDEIYFRDMLPWIWGELNQLHGKIDISYGVKGNRGSGMMRFKSIRRERMGYVSPHSSPRSYHISVARIRILNCYTA